MGGRGATASLTIKRFNIMKQLSHTEIKDYVIRTIRQGNKERIQAVMKRYQEYLKRKINSVPDIVQAAKKIFNV